MKKNMGTLDRAIRILIAIVVLTLYYLDQITGTAALILLAFAVIFIVTSFFSFCPLYLPFGINTSKKK